MTRFVAAAATAGVLLASGSVGVASALECDACMRDLAYNPYLINFECSPSAVFMLGSEAARCTELCSLGLPLQHEAQYSVEVQIPQCEAVNFRPTFPACSSCLMAKVVAASTKQGSSMCDELAEEDLCKSECTGDLRFGEPLLGFASDSMTSALTTLRTELEDKAGCAPAASRSAGRGNSPSNDKPAALPILECAACVVAVWDPTKVEDKATSDNKALSFLLDTLSSPALMADYKMGVSELASVQVNGELVIPTEDMQALCAKAKTTLDGLTACLEGDSCVQLSNLVDQAVKGLVELYGQFCILDVYGMTSAQRCGACLKNAKDGILAAIEGSTPDKCELYDIVMENISTCVKEDGDCANGAVDTMVVKETLQTAVNMFGAEATCTKDGQKDIVTVAAQLGISLEKQEPANVEWAAVEGDGANKGKVEVNNNAGDVSAGVIAGAAVGGVVCVAGMALVFKQTRRAAPGSSTTLAARGGDIPMAQAVQIEDGKSSANPMFDPNNL
jgi:hypothetical protein